MAEEVSWSKLAGGRLREVRTRLGLTITEGAGAVGMPPDSLSRLETGRRTVSVDDLVALSFVYDVSPVDVLTDVLVAMGLMPSSEPGVGSSPEFVAQLLEALPEVQFGGGWAPNDATRRAIQIEAVRSLAPIQVRMLVSNTASDKQGPRGGTQPSGSGQASSPAIGVRSIPIGSDQGGQERDG